MSGAVARSFVSPWLLVALPLTLAGGVSADEPLRLLIASPWPEASVSTRVARSAAGEIDRATGGRVSLRVLAAGQRGDDEAVLADIAAGKLDGAVLTSAGLAKVAREFLILEVPGLLSDYRQVDSVLEKLEKRLGEALAKKGLVLLDWGDAGFEFFFSTSAIRTPSDLKAGKPWVDPTDPVLAGLFERASIAATPLPTRDVLANLRTHVVQTAHATPLQAIGFQWPVHLRNLTNLKLGLSLSLTVVSQASWAKLTDDDKRVVRAAQGRWRLRLSGFLRTQNTNAIKVLKGRGVEIIQAEEAAWTALFTRLQDELAGDVYPKDLLADIRRWARETK